MSSAGVPLVSSRENASDDIKGDKMTSFWGVSGGKVAFAGGRRLEATDFRQQDFGQKSYFENMEIRLRIEFENWWRNLKNGSAPVLTEML